jgi:hydrogenase nickel incorporation protein HypB
MDGAHDHAHDHNHENAHGHSHAHVHAHEHGHGDTATVTLEQRVLARNDGLAERNREWLHARQVRVINLMSSPGSGKTTLLETTARALMTTVPISVIEGDQETLVDAERIQAAGLSAVQINTGSGCHLDAAMIADALESLEPPEGSLVFVENVGNLVCPALFDLGEDSRVVLMSVTEGEDKPLKYPQMFRAADTLLLNKIDLLPYLDFDLQRCLDNARRVNPALQVLRVSATKGDGLEGWYDSLLTALSGARAVAGAGDGGLAEADPAVVGGHT